MKPPLKQKYMDDYQTPPEALSPLYSYLPKDWVIWECASGKGKLTMAMREKGYKVIASDIALMPELDFLIWQPKKWDCIVTNPPYSLKQEFLERAYSFKKPFAFLLPLTTLETPKRQKLFKKYGLEIIFFDKRINFQTPSGKGNGAWFAVAWFTWGLNIRKELNWATLKRFHQQTLEAK